MPNPFTTNFKSPPIAHATEIGLHVSTPHNLLVNLIYEKSLEEEPTKLGHLQQLPGGELGLRDKLGRGEEH